MFCSYCKVARVENEVPCPNCGAPSPLLGNAQGNQGNPALSTPQQAFRSPGIPPSAWSPQAAHEQQVPLPIWQQSPAHPQTAQAPEAQAQPQQQQSLFPVLYQGGMQNLPHMNPQQLVTIHNLEHLLPAIPEEENTVFVPPMYTKPRPIIPKYRIISGFLSILIVSLLICAGTGYYANATGKLTWLKNFVGLNTPLTAQVIATPNIPDPPDKVEKGVAFGIISSATTTSRIDEKTHIALQTQKVFQAKQVFFVTYSVVNPGKDGMVTVKWYMNNMPFTSVTSDLIKAKTAVNGSARMSYSIPATGKVEIYWNDDLAITLHFAVR